MTTPECKRLADRAAADFRQLLDRAGFETDLEEAIAANGSLRDRFPSAATIGLMMLRNPLVGAAASAAGTGRALPVRPGARA